MSNRKFNLFVPGRLCIIGEHSDWAGIKPAPRLKKVMLRLLYRS